MEKSQWLMCYSVLVLLCIACIVWTGVVHEDRRGIMSVSFLDVGQGDAIFIDSPTGRQILIDGGKGADILRRLSTIMPWYDRSIDLVIGTHADMDHIGGLIDVLPRYRVGTIIVPSTEGDSGAWRTYLNEITGEDARVYEARRGERIDVGRGAYLEILFPDRSVPHLETNSGCIISRLVYGDTAFMFPCDAPKAIEQYLSFIDGPGLKSNVLKAGHHGSKTSSLPLFVGLVDPQVAVFSRGCDNTYGHPNPETINTFARFGIPTLDTCTDGTITFISNGQTVSRK